MSYVYYNPNPENDDDIDCVVRAICKLMDISWDEAYMWISIQGAMMHRIAIGNSVWSAFLESRGYSRHYIFDSCPDCYTVKDFCYDHPKGKYLLGVVVNHPRQYSAMDSGRVITGNHAVTVVDGDYYDAWDSGNEVPLYYWSKERRRL